MFLKHTIFILNKLKNRAHVNTWVLNLMAHILVKDSAILNSNTFV